MRSSRISLGPMSLGLMAAMLLASGVAAQTGDSDRAATAPPRTLSDWQKEQEANEPPAASDSEDQDWPKEEEPPPPPRRATKEVPPEVDTSDLLSEVPEDENGRPLDEPPRDDSKKRPAPAPVEEAPLAPPPPSRPEVQVQTLGTVEGPAEGLIDSSNGGLEENMWIGASRGDIETLLPKLPLASPDSAVRGLGRRLILTRADAPPGNIKRALVTIRIEKLLGAGLIDEAAGLAAGGSVRDDADFARVQADAILTAGRAADACSGLTSARLVESSQFWLQLRAYCAAASGDATTAEITRNILDAQQQGDPAYNILAEDALTGAKKPPGGIAKPTAMHLFLLRKAGLGVNGDIAKKLGVAASLLALRDAKNPPEVRLAAADRAVKAGAASTAELKTVVDAQAIAPGSAADVSKLSFLGAQAALRRAAQLESRPSQKAQLVHQALVLGDKAGLFEISARLQADIAAGIDAKAVPGDPLIGWSLLLAGKTDAATRWLGDNDAARAVQALAAGKEDTAQGALSEIAKQLSADPKPPGGSEPFEALVLGLYDALGLVMPADARVAAKTASAKHWPGRRPEGDVLQKIVQAASVPDRKGEAVMRILDVVGAAGPRDLAPDVTIELVRALEEMGLREAARGIAIHALLLYRPS